MRSWLRRLTEAVRTGFWALPALCVVLAAALALGLVQVDQSRDVTWGGLLFGAGADGAREVLSAITTSMITFTGLVFTITIVVLQLTSSQFSPRVLRTFLRDRQTQLSLGVFIATFVYAVLVLRTVSGIEDRSFVPTLATTVGVGMLLLSVAVFVAYIHHIATAIQVSSILVSIHDETRAVIEREFPASQPAAGAVLRPRAAPGAVIPAPDPGVLLHVDVDVLVHVAVEADVVLVSDVPLGSFVPQGAPLVEVHGDGASAVDEAAVCRAFPLGRDRTMQADVAFGFRQLSDIAARALSPGVNDPTTAVQALDALHDLLRRIATRSLPTGAHSDDEGRLRLHLPPPRFADFLSLALHEAEQYGADSLQVQQRIDVLLLDLVQAARPEHRPAVEAWLGRREGERAVS